MSSSALASFLKVLRLAVFSFISLHLLLYVFYSVHACSWYAASPLSFTFLPLYSSQPPRQSMFCYFGYYAVYHLNLISYPHWSSLTKAMLLSILHPHYFSCACYLCLSRPDRESPSILRPTTLLSTKKKYYQRKFFSQRRDSHIERHAAVKHSQYILTSPRALFVLKNKELYKTKDRTTEYILLRRCLFLVSLPLQVSSKL